MTSKENLSSKNFEKCGDKQSNDGGCDSNNFIKYFCPKTALLKHNLESVIIKKLKVGDNLMGISGNPVKVISIIEGKNFHVPYEPSYSLYDARTGEKLFTTIAKYKLQLKDSNDWCENDESNNYCEMELGKFINLPLSAKLMLSPYKKFLSKNQNPEFDPYELGVKIWECNNDPSSCNNDPSSCMNLGLGSQNFEEKLYLIMSLSQSLCYVAYPQVMKKCTILLFITGQKYTILLFITEQKYLQVF